MFNTKTWSRRLQWQQIKKDARVSQKYQKRNGFSVFSCKKCRRQQLVGSRKQSCKVLPMQKIALSSGCGQIFGHTVTRQSLQQNIMKYCLAWLRLCHSPNKWLEQTLWYEFVCLRYQTGILLVVDIVDVEVDGEVQNATLRLGCVPF